MTDTPALRPEIPAVSPAPRMHALDGVRAVAASLVVFHHLGIETHSLHRLAASGYTLTVYLLNGLTAGGVELFFVLSGVVLVRPYVRGRRNMNVASYFLRRLERLFPPFIVAWLLSGLTIYLASAFPTWWSSSARLPSFNWWDWFYQIGIVYWGDRSYNFAWWSLSTEVLFYLSVPLFTPAFRFASNRPGCLLATYSAAVLLSQLAFAHPLFTMPTLEKLIVYSSCFCAGMLLATMDFNVWVRSVAAIAGMVCVLISARLPTVNPHVGWGMLAFAVVSSASEHRTYAEKLLSRPVFVWLGERSYSIFLTHLAVITLVYHGVAAVIPASGAAFIITTRLMAISLALLTGMMLFSLVEKRFARSLSTDEAFWPWSVYGIAARESNARLQSVR